MPIKLNVSRLSNEMNYLLKLLEDESSISQNPIPINDDFDWGAFIDLVKHHRLYPQLYPKVKQGQTVVPTYVSEGITKLYEANIFHMLHLTKEMEAVGKIFAENDIPMLHLKGPMLAKKLYGDLSLRTSGDLDILIPIKDLGIAEKLLVAEGYRKDEYIMTVLNDWKWRHHHFTYVHPQKQVKIEIHWRLNPGPGLEPAFKELWERRETEVIGGLPVHTLGVEDLFVFLISHGSRHGWSRLRWLLDIHQMLKLPMDHHFTIRLLRKFHSTQLGGQAMILSSQLLSSKIPREYDRILCHNKSMQLAEGTIFYLERMINLHSLPLSEEISTYHKKYIFSLKSFFQKGLSFFSYFYPYPEDALAMPLPKVLHLLYFPLRPMIWLWRKTKKSALT
ncbi:nucleotidyltransferase domain-containing protein [Falsibacillus albus]|uniref:nucleotidyltransferase domain-containing protein n=1 Tax=Falsibacillus albus TaxID=2478915 RepID=UPI001F47373C|nr:nucleotidyltransferase family protein [Falsibacillus albus]